MIASPEADKDAGTGQVRLREVLPILGAAPPDEWEAGITAIAQQLRLGHTDVRSHLAAAVRAWDTDPVAVADTQIAATRSAPARAPARTAAPTVPATTRWKPLADELDPRLARAGDWGALAEAFEQADAAGIDVPTLTRQLLDQNLLNHQPANDLRYRLIAHHPATATSPLPSHRSAARADTPRQEARLRPQAASPDPAVAPRR